MAATFGQFPANFRFSGALCAIQEASVPSKRQVCHLRGKCAIQEASVPPVSKGKCAVSAKKQVWHPRGQCATQEASVPPKRQMCHSFELYIETNFFRTSGEIWRVYIPS